MKCRPGPREVDPTLKSGTTGADNEQEGPEGAEKVDRLLKDWVVSLPENSIIKEQSRDFGSRVTGRKKDLKYVKGLGSLWTTADPSDNDVLSHPTCDGWHG